MEAGVLDFFLELDKYLVDVIREYRGWTYLLMFGTIFSETGFIITALLPGDELLFAAGVLAARGQGADGQGAGSPLLDIRLILAIAAPAAFCGDQVNYFLGTLLKRKPTGRRERLLNRRTLKRAEEFYQRHGSMAVVFGRFIPVVRTVLPMTAALSGLPYHRFMAYSALGTLLWTCIFTFIGFFFGHLPFVREHFGLVLLAVLLLSIFPALIELLVVRWKRRKQRRNDLASAH